MPKIINSRRIGPIVGTDPSDANIAAGNSNKIKRRLILFVLPCRKAMAVVFIGGGFN